MIVATAGHIDHGKTSLVKALTGIDADRLPEEKRRGMTIDLGYAYLPVEGAEPIGFIDVPGHERLIHNMLCGVTGIDFALLVVAADDGAMPQTREHLAILDILGIARGAVALTKIDRVEAARVREVEAEIAALLAGTTLAAAPVFPVSAISGDGVESLKSRLIAAANEKDSSDIRGNFRLAVDRAFTVVGAGLVATGTVFSGSIRTGDEARLLGKGLRVRVRGIHAQNWAADMGRAGQRCALNVAGHDLTKDRVARGDWIVVGEVPPPARRIDVQLRIAGSEQPFAHWTAVHVHLGAAEATGRIALLEAKSLEPGTSGLAQLYLDHPIGAAFGDKFVIRDQSARRTLGGGRIVDVFPPARGRSRPERLQALSATVKSDPAAALLALLSVSPAGVDLTRFAVNRNLAAGETVTVESSVPMRVVSAGRGMIGFSPEAWARLRQTALDALAAWHVAQPESPGLAETRLFVGGAVKVAPEASAALAAELVKDGLLLRDGSIVRLRSHTRTMTTVDAALWQRVLPLLRANGLSPPALTDLAAALKEDPALLERLLVRVGRHGLAVRISKGRFVLPETLRELAVIVEAVALRSPGGQFGAAAFRDSAAIGRNLAIDVLEYFDRVKLTQRSGEVRKVIGSADRIFGHP
jgi:selenocysteine-specific elongation factor